MNRIVQVFAAAYPMIYHENESFPTCHSESASISPQMHSMPIIDATVAFVPSSCFTISGLQILGRWGCH
jgi:hypothetical protein